MFENMLTSTFVYISANIELGTLILHLYLKASKISGHLLLRDSNDPLVSGDIPDLKSGNWIVNQAVDEAE